MQNESINKWVIHSLQCVPAAMIAVFVFPVFQGLLFLGAGILEDGFLGGLKTFGIEMMVVMGVAVLMAIDDRKRHNG